MKHKLIQLISVILITAFVWPRPLEYTWRGRQDLAWVRPQACLGQTKGEAVLTGVGTATNPLSPSQNICYLRPRAMAEREVPEVLRRQLEDIILQVRERCMVVGDCKMHSEYLARRSFEEEINVQVMSGKGHWWVETIEPDGYVLDAFPEGLSGDVGLATVSRVGDEIYIIVTKDSLTLTAKDLYKGEVDKELTERARQDANSEEFYEEEIKRLSSAVKGGFQDYGVKSTKLTKMLGGFNNQLEFARKKLGEIHYKNWKASQAQILSAVLRARAYDERQASFTYADLRNMLCSKYVRNLLRGGPIMQPPFFALVKRDTAMLPRLQDGSFIDKGPIAQFTSLQDEREFDEIIRAFLSGEINFPIVYKPNRSALGDGIFFLTREQPGRITITMGFMVMDDGRIVGNYLEKAGIDGIRINPDTNIVQVTLDEGNPEAVRILHNLWVAISVDNREKTYDSGIVESRIDCIQTVNNRAYDTRHYVRGNLSTGEANLLREHWKGREGASEFLSNVTERRAARWLGTAEMFEPLYGRYVAPNKKVEFEEYVAQLLREEFRHMCNRLKATGIVVDEEISGNFDLMWLPHKEEGGFPIPVISETSFYFVKAPPYPLQDSAFLRTPIRIVSPVPVVSSAGSANKLTEELARDQIDQAGIKEAVRLQREKNAIVAMAKKDEEAEALYQSVSPEILFEEAQKRAEAQMAEEKVEDATSRNRRDILEFLRDFAEAMPDSIDSPVNIDGLFSLSKLSDYKYFRKEVFEHTLGDIFGYDYLFKKVEKKPKGKRKEEGKKEKEAKEIRIRDTITISDLLENTKILEHNKQFRVVKVMQRNGGLIKQTEKIKVRQILLGIINDVEHKNDRLAAKLLTPCLIVRTHKLERALDIVSQVPRRPRGAMRFPVVVKKEPGEGEDETRPIGQIVGREKVSARRVQEGI